MSTSIQGPHTSPSEPVVPSYAWVKLGSTRPIRVPTSNCSIVDDLIKLIKNQELPNQLQTIDVNQINLYSSNDINSTPLRADLSLSILLTPPNVAGTSYDNPLYIKIIDADSGIASSSNGKLYIFHFSVALNLTHCSIF
jgi:hypothetical protein